MKITQFLDNLSSWIFNKKYTYTTKLSRILGAITQHEMLYNMLFAISFDKNNSISWQSFLVNFEQEINLYQQTKSRCNSPYSQIFQSEAATALFANKYV